MNMPRRSLKSFLFFFSVLLVCLFILSSVPLSVSAKKATTTTTTASSASKSVIDYKHDIFVVTPKNLDSIITKYRDLTPACVLFFSEGDPKASEVVNAFYNEVGVKLKGMVKVAALDCSKTNSIYCDKMKIKKYESESESHFFKPTVVIYPTVPMPHYIYEGELSGSPAALIKTLSSLIPGGNVTPLTSMSAVEDFLADQTALPKVFLFSDKSKVPVMFNALANSFKDRVTFGFVADSNSVISKRFHVSKYPTVLVKTNDLSSSSKGAQIYSGDMNFQKLHDWVNIRSETFVRGGGFSDEKTPTGQTAKSAKPWLVQRVPELSKQSYNDVCFKRKSGFCLVYLKNEPFDETASEPVGLLDSEREMLESLADEFGDKGKSSFYFSWMNLGKESNFVKLFGVDKVDDEGNSFQFPSAVVFNPHKKIRFQTLAVTKSATRENLMTMIQTITNGDGHFKVVKGNKLPAFKPPVKPAPASPPTEQKQEL